MRAPNKSRLDKVIREIVEKIQGDKNEVDSAEVNSAEMDVRAAVALLRNLDVEITSRGRLKARTSIRGKKGENREEFKELLKQTKSLQKSLKKLSPPALFLLFSGERDLSEDNIPSGEAQQKVVHRVKQVTAMLAYMRARSNWLITEGPGKHGNVGYRQHRVAREAWHLMRRHGKEPAGGLKDSLYGEVASLLWEAMTDAFGKDLQRACKATLRLAKSEGLHDRGPVIGRGRIHQS